MGEPDSVPSTEGKLDEGLVPEGELEPVLKTEGEPDSVPGTEGEIGSLCHSDTNSRQPQAHSPPGY